tara:strand:- start:3299 stop:4711 length:1413 start_codon:yes stop_codon:yes gene_type:complete
MVPTFFAISLLIFVVMRLAPGKPGADLAAGGEATQDAQVGTQNEAYTLFKQQFSLDKPVLLNFRFLLGEDEVQETLSAAIDLSGETEPGLQIESKDILSDWGDFAVPGLINVLQTSEDPTMRSASSKWLASNARQRLLFLYDRDSTTEDRTADREREQHNQMISAWTFEEDATQQSVAAVTDSWANYYEVNQERWTYSTIEKLNTLFIDTQFSKYWSNLLRLDFGVSHLDKRPVLDKMMEKLSYSMVLSISTIFLIYLFSVPLGIWSAVNHNTISDRVMTIFLFILYSLPSFWVGAMLLNFLTRGTPFAVLPTSGFSSLDTSQMTTLAYMKDIAWHCILPIICMTYAGLAALSRYARTGLLDVIRSDYVRTARAKGVSEGIVIIKHAARNGMIPLLTLMATLLPALIGGSVVIEFIFGIPGIGQWMFQSIQLRDYNVVMAVLLISSVLTLIGMLLADLAYALVDPRISFE